MSIDVSIIGGGLSGLAAAVRLASRGVRVALFEQGPRLGGRCYSYIDRETGDVVDNGQHVLLGAYHNLLEYLELIGTRHLLRTEHGLRLPFHHPTMGRSSFQISSLPRPFHITTGMLRFRLLSWKDRQKLLRVGMALTRWNKAVERRLAGKTVHQWLSALRQSEEARRSFWDPIAISVMNEKPDRASALLFARSIRAAFLGEKSDSAILIPTVGQSELYVTAAEQFLRKHGAEICLESEVSSVHIDAGKKLLGLKLKNGGQIWSGAVVSAIPYFALERLIPPVVRRDPPFTNLHEFDSSPIVSVHLWFDRDFVDEEFVGLVDRTVQWVFNRRRIVAGANGPAGYLSGVISAAYDVVNLSKEEIVNLAIRDLHDVFRAGRQANLVHSIVIKEKRATFSPTIEAEAIRPSTETPIENFYLAGDWTSTGLPATIEGAVVSGFRAADRILGKSSGDGG